jgi:flagellar hook-basal body complex protein FliE
MNPLDALSTLTQVQVPGTNVGFQPTSGVLPTSGTSPISESFHNMLQPTPASQLTIPDISISSAGTPSTWGHMVQQMVMDVNSKQTTAAQKVSDVLQGGPTPVHEAEVATEEASLSFEFLAEMRNKVVESYQTVMQMQV